MVGQEDEVEDDEKVFHLVSYKWFRRTRNIPELGLFYKEVGKYPKIFTSNIRCIGNSILGLVGFPHIRKLCGNT